MTAPDEIIASKFANGFFADAEMSEGVRRAFVLGSDVAVDWLRRRMGGLWVGGSITLTHETLSFAPNALNTSAHTGTTSWAVPLARITEVADRFGWVTRIVDVRTDDGAIFTFRCFGARAFAEAIRRAVASHRAQAH